MNRQAAQKKTLKCMVKLILKLSRWVFAFSIKQVKVTPLSWNERYYLPQETGNYSVAGFKLNMERKMTHYVITYYLPSGLFVVVSWASFLIPSDDIQVLM